MSRTNLLDRLSNRDEARLIPVESKGESRVVSTLLAVFRLVPDYASMMLEEVGAPTNKRAKLKAFTEVKFKVKDDKKLEDLRPDGLLVVEHRNRVWSALIEAKIQGAELSPVQLENYLDLAREVGADAVITISNQFALLPTHHPVQVDRRKTNSVSLHHFSWLALLSNAQILADSNSVTDREQAFVILELIRFLQHDSTGVKAFDKMGRQWGDLCTAIQQGESLQNRRDMLKLAVADWHQLTRYLALRLSTRLGSPVKVVVEKKHIGNPESRLQSDIDALLKQMTLSDEFEIPNAAARICLTADLLRRTVKLTMRLGPPADRKRARAAITWFASQLNKEKAVGALIRCEWSGRTPDTMAPLTACLEDPRDLVPDGISGLPKSLEVIRIHDLAGRFRGVKTLVEDIETAFLSFYRDIGQDLRAYTPPPPKYRKAQVSAPEPIVDEVETDDAQTHNADLPSETERPRIELGYLPADTYERLTEVSGGEGLQATDGGEPSPSPGA